MQGGIECIRGCSSIKSGIGRVDWGIDSNDGSKAKVCLHTNSDDALENRENNTASSLPLGNCFGAEDKATP